LIQVTLLISGHKAAPEAAFFTLAKIFFW